MGACLCITGESEKSQYLLIKGEPKRFLPFFPGAQEEIPKVPRTVSNLFDESASKNTPATLMYYAEESPFSQNQNSNHSHNSCSTKEEKKTPAFEQFNIKKVIGKGSYGRVLLVEKKDTGILISLVTVKGIFRKVLCYESD